MRKLKELTLATAVSLSTVGVAYAQVTKPNVPNPVSGTSFGDILTAIINALLLFAGAVAVLFLIIGGFRYVVSAGNPEQVEAAKKTILYAILGLIVIFIAFVLVKLIQQYLGVSGTFTVR